ncbi:MAG: hypothetical protein ACM3ST_02235 [Bdellovibrio bacteriovorus]
MHRITTTVGLVPVLGGLMLLGGCTTLEYDDYWDSGYPTYSRHVLVEEYRYRNPDGLMVVYDPGPSLYSVVTVPGLYWHDGYYYRKYRGHWQRSRHHRGPWAIHRYEPPRVRVRHEPPAARPAPIAIPERRYDRGPVYRIHDREPDGRPPSVTERRYDRGPVHRIRDREPYGRVPRDQGRRDVVGRPPEQRRDPGRGSNPPRAQIPYLPGPQAIPWTGGSKRPNPPPVAAPAGRMPWAGQGVRAVGVTPPSPDMGRPPPGVVTQSPDRPRPGPRQQRPPAPPMAPPMATPVQPPPDLETRRQVRGMRQSPRGEFRTNRPTERGADPVARNPRYTPDSADPPRRRPPGGEGGWAGGPERIRF